MRSVPRPFHRILLTSVAVACMAGPWLRAATPLTDAQLRQLQTATDRSPAFDEAALYPLLDNASTWDPANKAGAMWPDFRALFDDPSAHRGGLFLLRGSLVEDPRPVLGLSRPLPRERERDLTLELWGLKIDGGGDVAVLVWVLDPPANVRRGAGVELVARFYKIWTTSAADDGAATAFLAFVGRGAASVSDGSSGSAGAGGPASLVPVNAPPMRYLLVLAGLLAVGVIFILRRGMKLSLEPRPLPSRRGRDPEDADDRRRSRPPGDDTADLDDGPPLPENPADALEELSRRGNSPPTPNPRSPTPDA